MFGRIHTVWHGNVPRRDDIRVNFGMIEHMLHIGILEHGVAHELVVRYGAAAAHLVISGHLVLLNLLAAQIPIIFYVVCHDFLPSKSHRYAGAVKYARPCAIRGVGSGNIARRHHNRRIVITYLTLSLNPHPRRIGMPLLSGSVKPRTLSLVYSRKTVIYRTFADLTYAYSKVRNALSAG